MDLTPDKFVSKKSGGKKGFGNCAKFKLNIAYIEV